MYGIRLQMEFLGVMEIEKLAGHTWPIDWMKTGVVLKSASPSLSW